MFGYDLSGRQTSQSDYDAYGYAVVYSRTASYDAAGKLTGDASTTVRSDGTWYAASTYSFVSFAAASLGQYLLGAVGRVVTDTWKNGSFQRTAQTDNTYDWRDGPRQSAITYKADTSKPETTWTDFNYAPDGAISWIDVHDGDPTQVTYRTNAEGQIIARDEQTLPTWVQDPYTGELYYYAPSSDRPREYWYRMGGNEWGYQGNNGTSRLSEAASIAERQLVTGSGPFRGGANTGTNVAEFGNSSDPINSYRQGSAAGSYTVQQTGETLHAIARALWGDASLWYKLAEANGLSAETTLVEGQRLTVPVGVARNTYNAGSVKPYDPASAIGDVSPSTPMPVAPKRKGCGIGAIFLAVIAIAVVAIIAPPLVGKAAVVAPQVVMGGAVIVPATTLVAATGLTAIMGATAGAIVGGAIAGAVGSIVSQGIGVVTGIQDKFSWSAVAMAAIGGGGGGGVASVLGKAASFGGAVL